MKFYSKGFLISFIFLIFILSLVSAEFGYDDSNLPKLTREAATVIAFNNNTGAVNSSDYWDALDTPNDIGIFLLNTGDTATGNYSFDSGTFSVDSILNRIKTGNTANHNILGKTKVVRGPANVVASIYALSVQSNMITTYIEILNDAGTGKGAFFGMENANGINGLGDFFTLYNWQGGPIKFFTEETASAGTLRMEIKPDGDIIMFENVVQGPTRVTTDATSPFATSYPLSVQNDGNQAYIEILNNGGALKGAFFGIENSGGADGLGDYFSLYNWQGGPMRFYTEETASAGTLRMEIKADGDVNVSENLNVGGDVAINTDNSKLFFGASDDVSLTMDGTSFNITDEVGSIPFNFIGFLKHIFDNDVEINGDLNVIGNINQTSGNLTGNMIYGEMWAHNDTDSWVDIINSQGVYINITINATSGGSGQDNNGFSFDPSNSALISLFSGKFDCSYDVSTGNEGNNQEYQFILAINNIIQNNTDSHRKIGSSGDVGDLGDRGWLDLSVGDRINLQSKNNDGTANLLLHAASVNCLRIGN